MTPQKIKLTRHDGSDVCPVESEAIVIVVYDGGDVVIGAGEYRRWGGVQSYAVIELVDPDPVIEVGDVVSWNHPDPAKCPGTVVAIHNDEAWVHTDKYGCDTKFIHQLSLVRKGGAV